MPTDGTLLLEHMPNGKQYLVTALSVFFSFGSVLAAVMGLVLIPSRSCPPQPAPCDVASQNTGWKYLLIGLGLLVSVSITKVYTSADQHIRHYSCSLRVSHFFDYTNHRDILSTLVVIAKPSSRCR